jgi:hypothetical protein
MLEMLLKEPPNSVRNALSIRVNAEKGTMVATRIVQRWRKPSNPISNTVGSISDSKIDFLISALYADKLPLKVAEFIRKDVPFTALLPLLLLNEIERTGKTSIDETVRQKRLDMKLVIVTSLGQGWLINHPECDSFYVQTAPFRGGKGKGKGNINKSCGSINKSWQGQGQMASWKKLVMTC